MKWKIRKMHGKLENFIKLNVLNYTHFTVARLTGLRLSGQLVMYNFISIVLTGNYPHRCLDMQNDHEPILSINY